MAMRSTALWATLILPITSGATRRFLRLASLAEMTAAKFTVYPCPNLISDAGMTHHMAHEIWSDFLETAGFEVVEDLDAPYLAIENFHEANNRVPD